jgi:hypothetical protein
MMEHSDIAVAVAIRTNCPAKHPSPRKSPSFNMAMTASFPLVRVDGELDFAFLDIQNAVCRVTLGKNGIVGTVSSYRSSAVGLAQKDLDIERRLGRSFRVHLVHLLAPSIYKLTQLNGLLQVLASTVISITYGPRSTPAGTVLATEPCEQF